MTARFPSGFDQVFTRLLGARAVDQLLEDLSTRPAVLIAGNQLTGKSTAARQVGRALGFTVGSTGTLVRQMAAKEGLTIEAMAHALFLRPETDASLDHAAFDSVAHARVGVYESRLAAWMAAWLRERGRTAIFAVFVTCSARERALRFVRREMDAETAAQMGALLDGDDAMGFAQALDAISRLPHPRAREVITRMDGAISRETHDRDRLRNLYGVDFLDSSPCDLVVDNTTGTAEQTRERILVAVRAALPVEAEQGRR